jgi:hypothetical protein
VSGGPTGEPGFEVPTGALFISADEEAAKLFVNKDPCVLNGIVTGHRGVEEWNVVVVQKEQIACYEQTLAGVAGLRAVRCHRRPMI